MTDRPRSYPRRNCIACGKPIVWVLTRSGRSMPVNAETYEPGDRLFQRGRHVSHFDTCPRRDEFRRPRNVRSPE